MVIGIHRGGVILVCQGAQRNVVVEEVLLAALRELAEELLEGGCVVVDVEGQLGVVEVGILLDVLVVCLRGGLFERSQGLYLVLGLDVGIAHLVIGYLTQGVGAHCHHREIVDGVLIVAQCVLEGSSIEVVRTGHSGVGNGVGVVVLLGLSGISHHQVRLREDA